MKQFPFKFVHLFFFFLSLILFFRPSMGEASGRDKRFIHTKTPIHNPSYAYKLANIILETIARDVEKIGARPTIISRQMAMPVSAMYDAWAIYDKIAGTAFLEKSLAPSTLEKNETNQMITMGHAVLASLKNEFPQDGSWIEKKIFAMDSKLKKMTSSEAAELGRQVAAKIIALRSNDGSNWDGKDPKSNGQPYSDTTQYKPVNPPSEIVDPDRWGPLPFTDKEGKIFHPGYLTAHWGNVKPVALKSGDQFRPDSQPKVGNAQLLKETDEVIQFNSSLTLEQKAIVEFMRDGPRSTGQSGHWLKFAQDVSRRDNHNLEQDVKLFFAIANVCLDAFIAAWDAKREYDSSRPWHLVRHYYKGKKIRGWTGPGKGVATIDAEQWLPYSPAIFITPPFPGYVSGHSTVSAASARILALFTGSDHYGFKEIREAGILTEEKFPCRERQKVDGVIPKNASKNCKVTLDLPTFTATAEMAGISRVMGGYHIQADNIAGLELGKKVADYSWNVYQKIFSGKK